MSQLRGVTKEQAAQYGNWTVWDETHQRVLVEFTAVLDMDFKGASKVPEQPVEEGSFFQYNKVASPSDVYVTLAKQGTHYEIGKVIDELRLAAADTRLLTVQTPGHILRSMNLEEFSYRRRSEEGAALLVAELKLKEIRQVSAQFTSLPRRQVKQAGDASTVDRGKVEDRDWLTQITDKGKDFFTIGG